MLRWITPKDKVQNNEIYLKMWVVPINEKIKESRLG